MMNPSSGMATDSWDRLVNVCSNLLLHDKRLSTIDSTAIHDVVKLEVNLRRASPQLPLAHILAGYAPAIMQGLTRGMLPPQTALLHPAVIGPLPPHLPSFPATTTAPTNSPPTQLPLRLSPSADPQQGAAGTSVSPCDGTATGRDPRQLAELESPPELGSDAKAHAHMLSHLSYSTKPPAKPLIPGGPCENPFCGVFEAPQWRRIDRKLVCNRCGMYFHRHGRFPDGFYFNGLASKQMPRVLIPGSVTSQLISSLGGSPTPETGTLTSPDHAPASSQPPMERSSTPASGAGAAVTTSTSTAPATEIGAPRPATAPADGGSNLAKVGVMPGRQGSYGSSIGFRDDRGRLQPGALAPPPTSPAATVAFQRAFIAAAKAAAAAAAAIGAPGAGPVDVDGLRRRQALLAEGIQQHRQQADRQQQAGPLNGAPLFKPGMQGRMGQTVSGTLLAPASAPNGDHQQQPRQNQQQIECRPQGLVREQQHQQVQYDSSGPSSPNSDSTFADVAAAPCIAHEEDCRAAMGAAQLGTLKRPQTQQQPQQPVQVQQQQQHTPRQEELTSLANTQRAQQQQQLAIPHAHHHLQPQQQHDQEQRKRKSPGGSSEQLPPATAPQAPTWSQPCVSEPRSRQTQGVEDISQDMWTVRRQMQHEHTVNSGQRPTAPAAAAVAAAAVGQQLAREPPQQRDAAAGCSTVAERRVVSAPPPPPAGSTVVAASGGGGAVPTSRPELHRFAPGGGAPYEEGSVGNRSSVGKGVVDDVAGWQAAKRARAQSGSQPQSQMPPPPPPNPQRCAPLLPRDVTPQRLSLGLGEEQGAKARAPHCANDEPYGVPHALLLPQVLAAMMFRQQQQHRQEDQQVHQHVGLKESPSSQQPPSFSTQQQPQKRQATAEWNRQDIRDQQHPQSSSQQPPQHHHQQQQHQEHQNQHHHHQQQQRWKQQGAQTTDATGGMSTRVPQGRQPSGGMAAGGVGVVGPTGSGQTGTAPAGRGRAAPSQDGQGGAALLKKMAVAATLQHQQQQRLQAHVLMQHAKRQHEQQAQQRQLELADIPLMNRKRRQDQVSPQQQQQPSYNDKQADRQAPHQSNSQAPQPPHHQDPPQQQQQPQEPQRQVRQRSADDVSYGDARRPRTAPSYNSGEYVPAMAAEAATALAASRSIDEESTRGGALLQDFQRRSWMAQQQLHESELRHQQQQQRRRQQDARAELEQEQQGRHTARQEPPRFVSQAQQQYHHFHARQQQQQKQQQQKQQQQFGQLQREAAAAAAHMPVGTAQQSRRELPPRSVDAALTAARYDGNSGVRCVPGKSDVQRLPYRVSESNAMVGRNGAVAARAGGVHAVPRGAVPAPAADAASAAAGASSVGSPQYNLMIQECIMDLLAARRTVGRGGGGGGRGPPADAVGGTGSEGGGFRGNAPGVVSDGGAGGGGLRRGSGDAQVMALLPVLDLAKPSNTALAF